jgi:excisionase family DNA binding protein
MLLTIKDLSGWLNIRPSTLYLWASRGKIPCRRIHGLIRFEREAILKWMETFETDPQGKPSLTIRHEPSYLEDLIAAAKRDVYTPRHGGTITPSPMRKENEDGAR